MEELFVEVIERFEPILTKKHYKKGQLLLMEESLSYKVYLVQKGVLRSFYFVEDKDITAHFAAEYGIIGAADTTPLVLICNQDDSPPPARITLCYTHPP